MATFKDMEDSLKNYIIQEQSDAHNVRNINVTKYNNIKIWMDTTKYAEPHFFVRISISEAVFTLGDTNGLAELVLKTNLMNYGILPVKILKMMKKKNLKLYNNFCGAKWIIKI